VIEVSFDQAMSMTLSPEMVAIEPDIDHELKWRSNRILQIVLAQPLKTGQRYDLTLRGGKSGNAFFAADGSYLAEDYRWFYWQQPFEAKLEMMNATTFAIKFNYGLDQRKSEYPFSITPSLDGDWKWHSSQEIRFTAKEPITAALEFTIGLTRPLVDADGVEIAALPTLAFSGLPPMRLATRGIEKRDYGDSPSLYADANETRALRIEFNTLVDHASAEKAFSLTPNIPGKFTWQNTTTNGPKETLIYTLEELLQPGTA
jgi:hypothetical protein